MSLIRALGSSVGETQLSLGQVSRVLGGGSYSVTVGGASMTVGALLPNGHELSIGSSAVIAMVNRRRYIIAAPDYTQGASQITVVIDV